MAIYLIRKLEHFAKLSNEERTSLERAASLQLRQLNPREDIIYEGDQPTQVHLILNGWACRYKVLEDGRRQILGYLIPGDICDMRMFILKEMDHSIGAVSPISVAEIPKETIIALTDAFPRLSRAFWWNSLVEDAITREWIINNSQRESTERMAHLFCELFIRLRMVGLTNGNSCEIPVTQAELGETMGLSTVHVNRTLQELRALNLVNLKGRILTIPDLKALQVVAMFNDNYLHLDRDGHAMDANEG
ncbi:cyclic nucleotide-binding protein [Microvirga vignae]|uniref:Cyclic nucleotide-binding protein n=1 Tax=Microvirga vignae TaxID=1225564 RepID=A0A0H1RFL6_9HYPH|nr:Crp/Fnr family transcriptional regulator [Microvirga vignae]KLK93985.1 cyclic nucleotide-binding protein [Microvirga vignae]